MCTKVTSEMLCTKPKCAIENGQQSWCCSLQILQEFKGGSRDVCVEREMDE